MHVTGNKVIMKDFIDEANYNKNAQNEFQEHLGDGFLDSLNDLFLFG